MPKHDAQEGGPRGGRDPAPSRPHPAQAGGRHAGPIPARPHQEARGAWGAIALYFGRYRGFSAQTHRHEEAQILLPLSGRMHLVAEGEGRLLGPEQAVWVPPGRSHGFTHVDGALDFLALELPWAATHQGEAPLPQAMAMAAQLPGPSGGLLVARGPELWLVGQALAGELKRPEGPEGLVVAGLVLALLAALRRASHSPEAPQASPEVLRAMQALLSRHAEAWRIPELAAELALSPRQLERRFQAELGQSPKAFLQQVRLAAAEHLLRETDEPVGAVGLAVGFATPAHFASSFRAARGHSPSEARRLARAQP